MIMRIILPKFKQQSLRPNQRVNELSPCSSRSVIRRTFFLFEQFSRAFAEADEVIITDIYSPAGEQQIEGVHSKKLADLILKNSNANTFYFPTKDEAIAYLEGRLMPGDLVITMGAGDIWKVADSLAKMLRAKYE